MERVVFPRQVLFSIVIPCFNEERTISDCIDRVLQIRDDHLHLEIIIVDDCSTDGSLAIAQHLAGLHSEITVLRHQQNMGKGAALRTGFEHARGEFVGIQDADLEYNPMDLRRLLIPMVEGKADVVFGSRYLNMIEHRVLYFWHTLMNKTLTFISNMFTDLDMTDMETCYKIFKKDILQRITIQENRFGFEPEIVAKVADMKLKIVEIGISYSARTYEEGKKIHWKDGLRALYCIFRYNAYKAPLPVQLLIYLFIGGTSAIVNLLLFIGLMSINGELITSAAIAFIGAALFNYLLCIALLFRHNAYWNTTNELLVYSVAVLTIGVLDVALTKMMVHLGFGLAGSKLFASLIVLLANFSARKYLVFPERAESVE